MLFFRVFQHLLPDATAWRTTTDKTLRRLFLGLSQAPEDARTFIDQVYFDGFPETTRELVEWERAFGLSGTGDEATRRLALAAAWQATGGQSPRYLQDVLQAAGFNVFVHEWWEPGSDPPVARDPRQYTNAPLLGTTRCGVTSSRCGVVSARCNRFLNNNPLYLVNKNLSPIAPPAIPDDTGVPDTEKKWPFFIYIGTQAFGGQALVPAERRQEFERLLLKLCPTEQWIVTMVNYSEEEPVTIHFQARANAATPGFWYGPEGGAWFTDQPWDTARGNGADPTINVFDIFPLLPFNAEIENIEFSYRPSAATVNLEVALYKVAFEENGPTVTPTQIGTTITIPSGESSANRYPRNQALSANNAVAKGEGVCPFFRPIGSHVGGIHFSMSLSVKRV